MMKLSFGEFPEHHEFLLITRPITEWVFKVVGWILVVSTIRYAYEKTGSVFILILYLLLFVSLVAFFGSFVNWFLSFRRYKTVSGKALHDAAELSVSSENSDLQQPPTNFWLRVRQVLSYTLALVFTMTVLFIANVVVEKVIDAIIEAQKNLR